MFDRVRLSPHPSHPQLLKPESPSHSRAAAHHELEEHHPPPEEPDKVPHLPARNPRERLSSTWANTSTRRSESSLLEVEKVIYCFALSFFSLLFFPIGLTPRRSRTSVVGVLKGYDQLLNLVLDEVEEQVLRKLCPPSETVGANLTRPSQYPPPTSDLLAWLFSEVPPSSC